MCSWNRQVETPVAFYVAIGLMMVAPQTVCWSEDWDPTDERIPRNEVTYAAETLSAETGAAVSGIQVRALANYTQWSCSSGDNDGNCSNCQASTRQSSQTRTTDTEGRMEATFSFVHCQYDPSNPMWISTSHESWGEPEIVGFEGPAEDAWVVSHIERRAGNIVDSIYVTKEQDLALRFAPIIHRHRGRERQLELADLVESVEEHSSLSAFDYAGRRIHGPSSPPPLHIVGQGLNSYGQSTTPEIWQLDIDDDWFHEGAAVGQRPLYYHAFPHGSGVVLQYWFWFNGNDLRGLPGAESRHEGDWEYLSLYLESDGGTWIPRTANLSQHAGGNGLEADNLWWSSATEDGYEGLQPGYDRGRPHPHVWLAANAHAVYTRFEETFELAVNLEPICGTVYADRVDYNAGGNSDGDHSFFRFDQLVNMGEFWIDENPSEGFWQWEGGPLEYLKFVGRFGDSFCVDPPGCPNTCDSPLYTQMSWAPHSPLSSDSPHMWNSFRHELGRWGNDPGSAATVRWVYAAPIGDYLGLFETCPEGVADTLRTFLYNAESEAPAEVQFTTVSGDVVVHDADSNGRMAIGAPLEGAYTIEAAHISGSGELRLDVVIPGAANYPLATDLRAHIEPVDCGETSAVASKTPSGPSRSGRFIESGIRAHPNPARGSVLIGLEEPLPIAVEGWQIHDARGRVIFSASTHAGTQFLRWNGQERSGRTAAAGIYFVSLVGRGGRTQSVGSFALLR